ncbi:MAG TPA: glycoside hydrolase family 16 protein [Terriglobales bacterium]|nr:glycoside hydrolase family 16 protein [Terriglobales bacterium]
MVTTISGCSAAQVAKPDAPDNPPGPKTWTMVWSDEFDGKDGSSPDAAKWTYDLGNSGWGNAELENYTNRTLNAQQKGGNLVITALKENYGGSQYTSARIKTQGLYDHAYGRVEARIKIPYGQGIWPAFWMLGNDIEKVQWPECGEIDIMENIGKEPATVYGTLHGPGYFSVGGSYIFPKGRLADDFHVYAIEWEPTQIRFYIDDVLYTTKTKADLPQGDRWPFDHNFFIILNVAVGGNWPGNPDETTVFPQTMLVDYVRVYEMK